MKDLFLYLLMSFLSITNPYEQNMITNIKYTQNDIIKYVNNEFVPNRVNAMSIIEEELTDIENDIQETNRADIKRPIVDESKQQKKKNRDIYIIGDSRSVAFEYVFKPQDLENDKVKIIGKVGMGLNYLQSLSQEIKNIDDCIIVFNFGINDLSNIDGYKEFYDSLPEKWFENNSVYIMSVNPVEEWKKYSIKNKNINEFNRNIKEYITSKNGNIQYIDMNNNLISSGYSTVDGIHYIDDTYKKIYNEILSLREK